MRIALDARLWAVVLVASLCGCPPATDTGSLDGAVEASPVEASVVDASIVVVVVTPPPLVVVVPPQALDAQGPPLSPLQKKHDAH